MTQKLYNAEIFNAVRKLMVEFCVPLPTATNNMLGQHDAQVFCLAENSQ